MDNAPRPPPTQSFWNIGDNPNLPGEPGMGDGVDMGEIAEMFGDILEGTTGTSSSVPFARPPPMRRWGSLPVGTSSAQERVAAERTSKLERDALTGFMAELCLSRVGANLKLSAGENKQFYVLCGPRPQHMAALKRGVTYRTNLCERAQPPTLGETSDEFEGARQTYAGRYYTPTQMLALPTEQRIGLLCMSSDSAPDWWLEPVANYTGALDTGARLDLDRLIDRLVCRAGELNATREALLALTFSEGLLQPLPGGARQHWTNFRISGAAETRELLLKGLNGEVYQPASWAPEMRSLLKKRQQQAHSARSLWERIMRHTQGSVMARREAGRLRAERGGDPSLLLETPAETRARLHADAVRVWGAAWQPPPRSYNNKTI